MRRAAAVIAATVVGLWLVLSFKSSPLPPSDSAVATGPPRPDVTPTAPSTAPPTAPPSTTPRTAPPTSASGIRTVDGVVVPNRYGDVQVEVVLQGNRIVDVKALMLPFDRARSQEISDQAAPLLRQEVLQAQSAQIDTIGGATFTSDGYARSLQSALDKARG